MCCALCDKKVDRNRLLKDITSPEAVTLIEKSDNEVFKLLNYEYKCYRNWEHLKCNGILIISKA